jgi:hypothetical protein
MQMLLLLRIKQHQPLQATCHMSTYVRLGAPEPALHPGPPLTPASATLANLLTSWKQFWTREGAKCS